MGVNCTSSKGESNPQASASAEAGVQNGGAASRLQGSIDFALISGVFFARFLKSRKNQVKRL